MIPTKLNIDHQLTSLPFRATNVSVEQQTKMMGGNCSGSDRYKCWVQTYAACGPAQSHDREWGRVKISRSQSSDSRAEELCKREFEAAARAALGCSYRGMHSQWIDCY